MEIKKLDFSGKSAGACDEVAVSKRKKLHELEVYTDLFLELSAGVRDKVALKGNILLNMLLSESARGTKDLDIDVCSYELYPEVIQPRLERFGQHCVKAGLADNYRIAPLVQGHSGGIKIYRDGVISYSVDVALSSMNSFLVGHVQYKLGGHAILGSSVERILADKTMAVLYRTRFRRIKDFYDMDIILSGCEYNLSEVLEILLACNSTDELNSRFDCFPFTEEVVAQCCGAWEKFEPREQGTGALLPKRDFRVIYFECSKYIEKLKEAYLIWRSKC